MIKDFSCEFKQGHLFFKQSLVEGNKVITIDGKSYEVIFDNDTNNMNYLLSYVHVIKINIDKTSSKNDLNCVCNNEYYKNMCKTKCKFGSKHNVFSADEPGEDGKIVQCIYRLSKMKNIELIIDNYRYSTVFKKKTPNVRLFSKKLNKRIVVDRYQFLLISTDEDGQLYYLLVLDRLMDNGKEYFYFVTGYPVTDEKFIKKCILEFEQ